MAEVVAPILDPKLTALQSVQVAPRAVAPLAVRPAVQPAVHRYVQDRTGNFRSLPFFALLNGQRVDSSQAAPLSTIFRLPIIARKRDALPPPMARFFAPQTPLQPTQTKPTTVVAAEATVTAPASRPASEVAKPILTRLAGRRDGTTARHEARARPALSATATPARPMAVTTARPNLFGTRPVLATPARPAAITTSQLPVTVNTDEAPAQHVREQASPQQALAQVKSSFELKVRAFAANLHDDGLIPMPMMPKLAKALSQSFREVFSALDKVISTPSESLTGDDIQKATAALSALGLFDELKRIMPGFEALANAPKASALTQFMMGLFFNPNLAGVLKGRLELLMMRQAQVMLAQAQARPMARVVSPRSTIADLRARRSTRDELNVSETTDDEETTLVTKPTASAGTDANGGGNQEQQFQQ